MKKSRPPKNLSVSASLREPKNEDGKPALVPKLRFPEFRNGPPWSFKKIGEMLEEVARPIEMLDDEMYSLVTVKRRYGGVVPREQLTGSAIKVKSQFIVRPMTS